MFKYLKKVVLPFLVFITLSSCKNDKPKALVVVENKEETLPAKIKEEASIESQYIINEPLIKQLELDLKNLALNQKFTLNVKPVFNKYDEKIVDTIKTFSFNNNKIEIYKSLYSELITVSEIRDRSFKFSDSISVGIEKMRFQKLVDEPLNSDVIKVGNLEQTSVFTFLFRKDKLNVIFYQGYVD